VRAVWTTLLVAAAVVAVPATADAATRIWVAPHGDDAGAGTPAAPFATPARAQRAARAARGDVEVVLGGGTYRLRRPLRLTARDSGVTWMAAPGERPVLSGAVRVPGRAWRPYARGIWRARVGNVRTRELYVDGRRATRAATTDWPDGFRPDAGAGGIQYLLTDLNPAGWRDPTRWGKGVEAVLLTQWKAMRVPVAAITPPSGTTPGLLRMAQPAWANANVFLGANGTPGIWSFWRVTRFENALAFLDEPGEWYLDERHGWLYYDPRRGERLRSADVELPVAQTLVTGAHVARVAFRGLTFAYATWLAPSGPDGYVTDQAGFHLVGTGHQPNVIGHDPDDVATPGHVAFRFARDVTFQRDRFEHLGAVGLALGTGSHDSTVRDSTFTDIGSSAIQLSGISAADHHPAGPAQESVGNTIAGNRIAHVGWSYPDAPGVFVGFSRATRVLDNTIDDVPWSGIAAGWGWGLLDPGGYPGVPGATRGMWGDWPTPTPNRDSVIAGNTITRFLGLLWDGGAIYTTGWQGTSAADGLRIERNVAHGKRPLGGGNTFYTDGGTRFVTVRDNVSYDNPIGAAEFGPPPRAGDPLPFDQPLATLADGVPYGGDIGGCRTFGDIAYVGNRWMQPPMQQTMADDNALFLGLTQGALAPWSPDGFFDVCPFTDDGVSYPTGLTFTGNTIHP
jgi:hypothetical protein